jgi:hypothetical protein
MCCDINIVYPPPSRLHRRLKRWYTTKRRPEGLRTGPLRGLWKDFPKTDQVVRGRTKNRTLGIKSVCYVAGSCVIFIRKPICEENEIMNNTGTGRENFVEDKQAKLSYHPPVLTSLGQIQATIQHNCMVGTDHGGMTTSAS